MPLFGAVLSVVWIVVAAANLGLQNARAGNDRALMRGHRANDNCSEPPCTKDAAPKVLRHFRGLETPPEAVRERAHNSLLAVSATGRLSTPYVIPDVRPVDRAEEETDYTPPAVDVACDKYITQEDCPYQKCSWTSKSCQEIELDCWGSSMNPNTSLSEGITSSRELLWSLKHRKIIPADVVDRLLDFHGQHETRFRDLASKWALSQTARCARPRVCRRIAWEFGTTAEGSCPNERLLSQMLQQLEGAWHEQLLSETGDEKLGSGTVAKELDPAQLIVTLWGERVLSDQGGDSNQFFNFLNATSPWAQLVSLVRGLRQPDADLSLLLNTFLSSTTRASAAQGSSQPKLVSLFALLQQQRSYVTIASLVRDCSMMRFYEPRVAALEAEFATLRDGTVTKDAVTSIQQRLTTLLQDLRRLEKDHDAALPDDMGALPALWVGRSARLERFMVDVAAGRPTKKTVLIWTCSFGGGHRAATYALQKYLEDFSIVVTDPTRDKEYYEGDTVGDWIRRYVNEKWDNTYMFNEVILRWKEYRLENAVEKIQELGGWLQGKGGTRFNRPCPAPECDYEAKKFMRRAFLRAAPDYVITVYHMDLFPIMELCEELGNLPLMHVATDADVKMYEVFSSRPTYANLRVGIPYDLDEVYPTIAPLTPNQTFLAGYVVRPSFMKPLPDHKTVMQNRLMRGIPSEARVALVMSGSKGQAVTWPEQLANAAVWTGIPLHVIIVVGSNHQFGRSLEERFQPRDLIGGTSFLADSSASSSWDGGSRRLRGSNLAVTLEVAVDPKRMTPNTSSHLGDAESGQYFISGEELSDLMDIADVLVTKGGGSTTAEASYRGIPVLFDATDGMLRWEAFTADMFESHGRGKRFTDPTNITEEIRYVTQFGRSTSLVEKQDAHLILNSSERIRKELLSMR